MKLLQIFRFEAAYQVRRLSTWLYALVLAAIAFAFVRGNFLADAVYDDFYVNAPFVISFVTVFGSLFWLLLAATVTGEIAARDWQTNMQPLSFTAPVGKWEYLGGRLLAALTLNAGLQLAVPLGAILAIYTPGVDPRVIGPFRPGAFINAYFLLALPNAFIGTAIQFACATLARRGIASYAGSVLLFVTIYGGVFAVYYFLNRQDIALLFDAFAQLTMFDLTLAWTPYEKSTRAIGPDGPLLLRRALWILIAAAALGYTFLRFRFTHFQPSPTRFNPFLHYRVRRRQAHSAPPPAGSFPLRQPPRSFGTATQLVQLSAIARSSYWTLARSATGFPLLAVMAALVVAVVPEHMHNMGTPLLPRTAHVLSFLTAPASDFLTPWVVLPLLIILYSGKLVWRERDAGLGELTDAAPVPQWAVFLGRYLGLSLMLVTWTALLMLGGIAVQLRMGYTGIEPIRYLQILFGLQLPEYLLFALPALVIQGLIGHKYTGHLAALLAYLFILFASRLGITHHLLVFGTGPDWTFNDMRGFGGTLAPWLWFKLYWAAWAVLLGITGSHLLPRGREQDIRARLSLAGQSLTSGARAAASVAGICVLATGSYIFYNTNVRNEYNDTAAATRRKAGYELRYGKFRSTPQPGLTAATLQIELYPDKGALTVKGRFQLKNNTGVPIDTLHLATMPHMHYGAMRFDRQASLLIRDDDFGHRSYRLAKPLPPGDTMTLDFSLQQWPTGFRNNGVNTAIVANGTYITARDVLPAIGYQASRELIRPAERRVSGLPARALVPSLADADITGEAAHAHPKGRGMLVETVIGTDADQTAIAAGTLRRSWTRGSGKGARRYFQYRTEMPVGEEHAIFSARYSARTIRWTAPDGSRTVPVEIYYHPAHGANVDRLLRSALASLDYYSREFGTYPFAQLRLIENPVRGMGAHSETAVIDYGQGFSLFNPAADRDGLDFPFAIMAHEVAHQWWGAQLSYALAEGAGLLTESPAWYAAMGVVNETYGKAHLQRLLRFFRQPYPIPQIRQTVPLLRGRDPYAAYRKGPFALYALSEHMGMSRVNSAYRNLLRKHLAGGLPQPTSLDLYKELQSVTPDTLQPLLHDLFAANTYWDLKTEAATAVKTSSGAWQVTLQLQARKTVSDTAGRETELPMDEWVHIGIFAPAAEGADYGKTLYLQQHRIRSGRQRVSITVPQKPADAGIDPYHLLTETERYDNVERVKS